jgi:hypothetical protein
VDGLISKTRGVELDDEEESGTGVLTSQLRHFVIQASLLSEIKGDALTLQEYLPRPVLFDIAQTYGTPSTGLEGSKVSDPYIWITQTDDSSISEPTF